MVEKYVLREVRAQANADRARWIKEYNANRLEEKRQTSFVQDFNRGDTSIAAKAFATYPGSFERSEMNLRIT